MKYISCRSALAVLPASLLSCGGGRNDSLASKDSGTADFGGQLVQGKNGPNRTVTDEYKYGLAQDLIPLVFRAYLEGSNTLSGLPSSGDSLPDGVDSLPIVRMNGTYFGRAEVQLNAQVFTAVGDPTRTDLTLTFFDFADSAATFVGGTVDCRADYAFRYGIRQTYTLTLNRGVLFAGDFSENIVFNRQQVLCNDVGLPYSVFDSMWVLEYRQAFGDLTFTSRDNKIVFNPYYRNHIESLGSLPLYDEPPPPPPFELSIKYT